MTPVRMAVMILLQHPQLYEAVPDTDNLHRLDMPGLAILIQLLETMREHPHLKTAQLLERWRDTQQAPYMEKLAMQPLNLSPEQLEHELIGIVSRLNKQARDERYTYLINKGLSNLTESERIEINSYK